MMNERRSPIKVRRHPARCSQAHRTYKATAKCIWPSSAQVEGEGPYALVSTCYYRYKNRRKRDRVLLFKTLEAAEKRLGHTWGKCACGWGCGGGMNHKIVEIELPQKQSKTEKKESNK